LGNLLKFFHVEESALKIMQFSAPKMLSIQPSIEKDFKAYLKTLYLLIPILQNIS